MRTFIAIDITDTIKAEIERIQNALKSADAPLKWVQPKNIHITLKFLGNIDEGLLASVKDIVTQTAKHYTRVSLQLTTLGCFPDERRPRVLFVATNQQQLLKQIADDLEKRLQVLGFPSEGKFQSHITIARCKLPSKCRHIVEQAKALSVKGDFSITSLTIYKSTLTPKGPVYEKLWEAPLR